VCLVAAGWPAERGHHDVAMCVSCHAALRARALPLGGVKGRPRLSWPVSGPAECRPLWPQCRLLIVRGLRCPVVTCALPHCPAPADRATLLLPLLRGPSCPGTMAVDIVCEFPSCPTAPPSAWRAVACLPFGVSARRVCVWS
jgi:hypothetical protein